MSYTNIANLYGFAVHFSRLPLPLLPRDPRSHPFEGSLLVTSLGCVSSFSQRGLPHAAILEKHTINGDNNSSLGTQMDLEDALIFLCMNTRGKQWKTMNIRESTG